MRKHWPLLALVLFSLAAAFGPVAIRNRTLQFDLDGGGHTISNVTIEGAGGDTIWRTNGNTVTLSGIENLVEFAFESGINLNIVIQSQSGIGIGALANQPFIVLSQFNPDIQYMTVLDGAQNNGDLPYYFNTGTNVVSSSNILSAFANANTNKFAITGEGAITLSGTTNQVTFGGTNTAPADTTNVAKWISVQVSGFTNAYRIGLHE